MSVCSVFCLTSVGLVCCLSEVIVLSVCSEVGVVVPCLSNECGWLACVPRCVSSCHCDVKAVRQCVLCYGWLTFVIPLSGGGGVQEFHERHPEDGRLCPLQP